MDDTVGIGLTINTCLTFIFASLVYRLHAGTFIRPLFGGPKPTPFVPLIRLHPMLLWMVICMVVLLHL